MTTDDIFDKPEVDIFTFNAYIECRRIVHGKGIVLLGSYVYPNFPEHPDKCDMISLYYSEHDKFNLSSHSLVWYGGEWCLQCRLCGTLEQSKIHQIQTERNIKLKELCS